MDKHSKKRMIIFFSIISIFAISIVIASKHMETNEEHILKSKPFVPTTQWVEFKINGNSQWADLYSNEVWYDTPMLTTEQNTTVCVGNFSGYDMKINGMPIQSGGKVSFRLKKLAKSQSIAVEIKDVNNNNVRYHHFRTLPSSYAAPTILSNHPQSGFYCYNADNCIYKMDADGKVVFYKNVSGGFDFECSNINGKIRYSYLQKNSNEDHPKLANVNYETTKAVVMDENYKVIDEVPCLIPNKDITENQPLSNYKFTILGDRHYIVDAYVGKRVNNIPDSVPHSIYGTRVAACMLQEIKDGKLIWQWDSTNYPELYELSTKGNDYTNKSQDWADYVHFDSIAIDPKDNNFICSFENLNSIIKLNRITGKVIWILGGKIDQFGLNKEQIFRRQSCMNVAQDGSIVLADRSNADTKDTSTNIVEISLDEKNKKIASYHKYVYDNVNCESVSSVQKLNDGVFVIGWGKRQGKDTIFSEINFNTKKVLFEFLKPYDGENDNFFHVSKFSE